jgi:uncharacterized damage-inducible protein DinB
MCIASRRGPEQALISWLDARSGKVYQKKEHTRMESDQAVRKQLIALLHGGHSHVTFSKAVAGFPLDRVGTRPEGVPHSAWEQLEHMRIAQEDILRFSQSGEYVSPEWPAGYWPASPLPADAGAWDRSVRAFQSDLAEFESMLRDPGTDLYQPFPWGQGQTLFREALVLGNHNSYHTGQLVLLRQALGAWPPENTGK